MLILKPVGVMFSIFASPTVGFSVSFFISISFSSDLFPAWSIA